MKPVLLSLALILPGTAFGQRAPGATPTPPPDPRQAAAAFAERAPDEGSPFFTEREAAKYAISAEARQASPDTIAVYPMSKESPDSASSMFKRFFTDMFSSINFRFLRSEPTTEKVMVDPDPFFLDERREVDVVYTLRNNSRDILRLDYPTTQRIDILTKDQNGQVLEKWSDDRIFEPREGVIFINPKERIEYQETIPTRDMKKGEPYTIQVDVPGYPEYTGGRVVTPQ